MIKARIIEGHVDFSDNIWEMMPRGQNTSRPFPIFKGFLTRSSYHHYSARNLVAQLMIYNPLQRLDIYGALESPWIFLDLNSLEAAYRERIGIL